MPTSKDRHRLPDGECSPRDDEADEYKSSCPCETTIRNQSANPERHQVVRPLRQLAAEPTFNQPGPEPLPPVGWVIILAQSRLPYCAVALAAIVRSYEIDTDL
jgi:hypothetical protein